MVPRSVASDDEAEMGGHCLSDPGQGSQKAGEASCPLPGDPETEASSQLQPPALLHTCHLFQYTEEKEAGD